MIFQHYFFSPWDKERWPNFSPDEEWMHCRCCGEFYYDETAFDSLQAARNIVGMPFNINSGHRCVRHNTKVNGAPKSEHLRIAFDISTHGHDRRVLFNALKAAGFRSFGFYKDFIHADLRKGRRWYGKGAAGIWKGIVDF